MTDREAALLRVVADKVIADNTGGLHLHGHRTHRPTYMVSQGAKDFYGETLEEALEEMRVRIGADDIPVLDARTIVIEA